MKLWKRAAGALKDNHSLFKASFTRRSGLRNPDIEAAVIKATSHDPYAVDYRNAHRVFAWLRLSDSYLRPVLWAISYRLEKTQNWVVAIKSLILLHGVFCCKIPAVQSIGRLPFDLSRFRHRHSGHRKTWTFDHFIRNYYAFLDQKSSFIFLHSQQHKDKFKNSMMKDLVWLQKLQGLLDLLLQIKPQSDFMINVLVLEAMDCVVIEIFDVYSRICTGIAGVLDRIYSAGKTEARMALTILKKATVQGDELALYFEFCKDIGVINASECPNIERIPEEDVQELELFINGVSDQSEEEKSVIVVEKKSTNKTHDRKDSMSSLKTIITDDWEVFEEENNKKSNYQEFDLISLTSPTGKNNARVNPFVERSIDDLPDLISF